MKWSSVWSKFKVGLGLAAFVWPPAAMISAGIDRAENIVGVDGKTKLQKVEAIAELAIDYSTMSLDNAAKAKALVNTAIHNELQVREAVAASKASWDAVKDFVESVAVKD